MARLAQFGCVLGGGGRCTALFLGATRGARADRLLHQAWG